MTTRAEVAQVGDFFVLRLDTNNLIDLTNYSPYMEHGVRLTVFQPAPDDMRAVAKALIEGADAIERGKGVTP